MSTAALKWLALFLMVLDHLGEFFPKEIPLWFRYLGRMSAPLFLFCLAVGLKKTRSRKRYIGRLWLGAAVMGSGNFILTKVYPDALVPINNNIFSTMVIIAVLVWIIESFSDTYNRSDRLKDPKTALAIFVVIQLLATSLSNLTLHHGLLWARMINGFVPNLSFCEGKMDVVLLGLILYFCMDTPKYLCIGYGIYSVMQMYASVTMSVGYGNPNMIVQNFYQWMMIGALPFMLLYNGKKGEGTGKFFYFFYPAHIWILFIMSNIL